MEYLKSHGHPEVIHYSPKEIFAWFGLARRNRQRELSEWLTVMLAAARGDEKALTALWNALGVDPKKK